MSQINYSPYKKAILFEKIESLNSNKDQVVDPFNNHWANHTSLNQNKWKNQFLLAIGAVIIMHYSIFHIAQSFPTPPLIIKKPEPVIVEILKPKEAPAKITEPKLKPAVQKPMIPPISENPKPIQKQIQEKTVKKPMQQAQPITKAVSQPVQKTEITEHTTPTSAVKTVEPVTTLSQENLPVTVAKGYAGYLSNPAPEYPDIALDRGWEGAVMLRVKVSSTGSPLEINIKNGSGKKALDDAAIKTVKRWKFSPAVRGNTAIEGWVDVPIHFKLPT